MPKLVQGQKTTIDYTSLDRRNHSKVQIVKKIPHEGEVLKCRLNEQKLIASILNTGIINLYSLEDGQKKGILSGLTEESFCLDWNKKRAGLLISAAGSSVCIWDVNEHITQDASQGIQLLRIEKAHENAESEPEPVNDVKFSPHNDHQFITSGNDGFYKM